jgi:Dolichyl-phosphate-mannose-protein mannosyltransferase
LATIFLLGLMLAWLMAVAVRLRVDYFDSYESFRDAQAYLSGNGTGYLFNRGLLFPALLTPFLQVSRLLPPLGQGFVLVHAASVIVLGLLFVATWRVFRSWLHPGVAAVAALLLTLNPILIRYTPVAKEDLPATLVLVVAFGLYLRGRQTGETRWVLAAAAVLGCLMSLRYSMIGPPIAVIGVFETLGWYVPHRTGGTPSLPRAITLRELAALVGLPLLVMVITPMVAFPVLQLSGVAGAPTKYFAIVQGIFRGNAPLKLGEVLTDTRSFEYMWRSLGLPLLTLAGLGFWRSMRERRAGTLFFATWLVVLFLVFQVVVANKEARYLMPALPPLYFFVGRGLECVTEAMRHWFANSPARTVALAGLLAMLLALPAYLAIREAVNFGDPFYSTPYEADVSLYAAKIADGHNVLWSGPYYALHPRSYVFSPNDSLGYIFHFAPHVVSYWSRKAVYAISGGSPGPDLLTPEAAQLPAADVDMVSDGDAVIVNLQSRSGVTDNVPQQLTPLYVEKVSKDVVRRAESEPNGTWTSPGGIQVALRDAARGLDLAVTGLKPRPYNVFARTAEGSWEAWGHFMLGGGKSVHSVTRATRVAEIEEVVFVGYYSARVFAAPL